MADSSSVTVLDDLPDWIIIDAILVQLPPKDVLRCRAVRTSSRSGTSIHEFICAHHRRQPSLLVIYVDGTRFDVFNDIGTGASTAKKRPILRPSTANYSMPELKAICDGLLLIFNAFNDYHILTCFYHVCNTATHQYAPLPQIPSCLRPSISGLYWHKPSGEYRVLYSTRAKKNNDFHVLTMGSDKHRCIGQPPLSVRSLEVVGPFVPNFIHNAPVLHRGCLHWRLGRDSGNFSNILIFDTTVETFRSMRYPAQPGSWPGLLQMDGALALCSTADGVHIDVLVMQDYEAEIWAFKCRINLSAVAAPLPSYALSPRMAMLNEREFLIQLDKRLLHCDIDGKLLGNVDEDNNGDMWVTSHFLQESIIPLPFSKMQEDGVNKHPFTF